MNKTRSLLVRLAAQIVAVTLVLGTTTQAAVQVAETMLVLTVKADGQSAASDVFRQGSRSDWGTFYNPTLNNNLTGTTPGTPKFLPTNGDVLQLKRVFIKSNHWNGGDIPAGAPNNNNWIAADNILGMWYSVTPAGGADNWQFVQVARTIEGNVQEWNANTNINLLSGLADGIYTLKVYFEIGFNSWDGSVVVGKTFDGSALAPTGSATFQIGEPPPDHDADGIPDAEDPDDDNDGLLDTVETNTGVWVSASDTGTNPKNDDTDGDGLKDNVETNTGEYVSATNTGSNPLVADQARVFLVGNSVLFPGGDWQVENTNNLLSPSAGGPFNVKSTTKPIAAPGEIEFKFSAGSWDVNWGVGSNVVTAVDTNTGTASGVLFRDRTPTADDRTANVKVHRARGEYVFTFNDATNSYAFSVARKSYATLSEFVAAYGLTGANAQAAADSDGDGLDNLSEFAANTAPDLADSDGDGLSDGEEIRGDYGVATNPLLRDTDGDGLLDLWELTNNFSPTDPTGVNGAEGDPDNDGATNIVEQANGTDPNWAGTGFSSPYAKITVPGSFNGWNVEGNWENSMRLIGNNTWGAMIRVTTNSAAPTNQFKFAPGSFTGSWGRGLAPNVAVKGASENLLTTSLNAAGYYRFDFNDFTGVYSITSVSGGPDTNSNGLPDAYEEWYGALLVPPVTTLDPESDPDGDGLTVLQEFNAGSNPTQDVSPPVVSLAPNVHMVTWYAVGSSIPSPSPADVVATDDNVSLAPTVQVLSPDPLSANDGFSFVIYRATDAAGNTTDFTRLIVVGNANPGYWNLRFPATMNLNTASSNFAYGEIFIDGATAGSGQATGVQAWVGVNSNNTDPATWDESAWTAASYIGEEGNNDNYQGQISGIGRTPGTYYYATRFQLGTNSSNTNYFFGGIGTDGVGGTWGSIRDVTNVVGGVTNVTTYTNGSGVLTVQATRQVTFAVDMGVQIFKGAFDPSTNGVELRATFNGFAGGASTLSREGISSIYSGTFAVGGGEGSTNFFKFFSTGTNAVGYENGADREAVLTANDVPLNTGTNFFSGISESRKITFRVDMSKQIAKGNFNASSNTVSVAGSFNGWTAVPLAALGGDVYGAELFVDGPLAGVEYKFINGTNYEGNVSNRSLPGILPNLQASTLDAALFNNDDAIGPVITLNGTSPVSINVGDSYTDAGATATDAIDGVVTVTPTGSVDTTTAGTYTITYNASDAAGNAAIAITRTVIVTAAANPYDSWTSQNNLTGADAQPTADPDNDGFTNRQEYAFGGNPNGSDAGLLQTSRSGGNLVLTWLQRTDSAAGYKVRSTTNLSAGFADNATLTGQAEDATSQAGVPQGYVRRQLTVAITGERNFLALAFDL